MRGSASLKKLLALFFVSALVLAACGDDSEDATDTGTGSSETTAASGGGDKKTVAIAFVGPLTGPNAALGINIRNGMQVAIEEANEEGDYEFVLKPFDTQGDPAQAPTVKDKYINDEEILAVVGPTFSGETKAVLKDLNDANLAMISASATNVDLPNEVPDGKSFHRVVPDDDVQGQGVADYVTKVLKAETVFYINDNTDYGKGVADGTQGILEDAGVETAGTDAIDPKSQDYSSAVNKAKAANADVIFYGGYYAEAGRLSKQLKDADVEGTFMSGDGSLDVGFIQSAGAAGAEGALITCACKIATEDSDGGLGEFAKKYKEITNANAGTYSTEGYDAANIFIEGVKAGNDTREKLLEYVEGLGSYEGLSKTIEFEENGNVKAGDVYVYEYKGGKIEELGTIEELIA